MSREIKFRAWDKNAKRMNYFDNPKDGILYCCNGFIVSNGWDSYKDPTFDTRPDKKDVIEQYTGLKDKNGKEIYEGDVLVIHHRWSDLSGYYLMVHWGKVRAGWIVAYHKGDTIRTIDLSHIINLVEIIGNIHENPELWEVKNETRYTNS